MTGFEGSFLGATDKISAQAVMECKICWTPYDPAIGDDFRQIDPGTAFVDLPEDWTCPNCSSPREQFLVSHDPGSMSAATAAKLDALTAKLVTDFTEVWHAKMRDVPMVNKVLTVEAVGWMIHEGRPLGVLISPWFMNLILLPGDEDDWSKLTAGEKEVIGFGSGEYEFIHNSREMIGGYKACSLFSPMGDFSTQAQAVEVAQAVMVALFDETHRAETDRTADIRAAREAEIAQTEEAQADSEHQNDAPTRRRVITGGLAAEEAGA